MIRYARILLPLLAVLLAAACRKDAETPQIRISTQEILLSGDATGDATFTVTAGAAWGLTYRGDGFSVSPDSGAAGETTVTVSPTEVNTEKSRRQLGSITIHYSANRQEYTITVS